MEKQNNRGLGGLREYQAGIGGVEMGYERWEMTGV